MDTTSSKLKEAPAPELDKASPPPSEKPEGFFSKRNHKATGNPRGRPPAGGWGSDASEGKEARPAQPSTPRQPKIKAAEVAASLEPITAGVSTVLEEKGLARLDEKEDTGWRAAAGKVAEKYLAEWIVSEIMLIILTASIVLRRTKGFKATLAVFGMSLIGIVAAVFFNKRRKAA